MLIKSLRSLFALLVLVAGLGFASTAMAADEQSSQQKAQTSEADLWRAVKSGESGYTTAKGLKPAC